MEDTIIETPLKTFQDYYLKKDYPNALLTLQKNQQSIDPGIWHYNMGTVAGEMNNWPLARYHFLLADKNGFEGDELKRNEQLTLEKLEVVNLEKPLNTSDYLIKASLFAAEGVLVTVSLLILIFGLWSLRKSLTWGRIALVATGTALPILLHVWINSWDAKIIMSTKPLHEGPSALFGINGEVPAGVLILSNEKGEWEEIVFPSRFSGWIKSAGNKKLE